MSHGQLGGGRSGRMLVVDDDRPLLAMLGEFLRGLGHDVDEVSNLEQARAWVRTRPYQLVISDLFLDRGTGLDLLREIRAAGLRCEVLLMTAQASVETAIEAIREGAYDYLSKPVDLTRLEIVTRQALERRFLEEDRDRLARSARHQFGGLIGASEPMRLLFDRLARIAPGDSTVLLLGESGTGKELAARALHEMSPRQAGPFVAVNCGAIAHEILESSMFGHVKGAFTGAVGDRPGYFVAASGGTIFLDEIATAPHRVQVGLLRVLQERVVQPVGSAKEIPIDVRIVAATNADLDVEKAAKRFREDLFHRLSTISVRLPPLRERRDDIPLLVSHLLQQVERQTKRRVKLSPGAVARLMTYDWPGNVRELEHMLEQVAVLADGPVVQADDLPIARETAADGRVLTLEEVERNHILEVLRQLGGNKQKVARALGIPRASLYRRLERYGIDVTPPAPAPIEITSPPSIAPRARLLL